MRLTEILAGEPEVAVTGPANPLAFRFGQLPLGEVGQFQIVEKQIDEFVAAQHEPERILAVALAGIGSLAAALSGTRQHVALDELLVAGKHHVAGAAFAAEARLIHAVEGDADFAPLEDILDVALLRRLLDGALHQCLGATQKALTVLETLAARIEAPIDDVHGGFLHPPQPACLTRMYHSTSRRTWRSV